MTLGQTEVALFERLLLRLVKRLEAKIHGRPQARELAEDAAMSAIKSFVRKYDEGQTNDQVRVLALDGLFPLLWTIAKRKLWKRVAKDRKTHDDSERILDGLVSDADFELLVDEMADALPGEMQRKVLLLHVQGHTQKEIGDLLGLSDKTIRQRLKDIRNQLDRLYTNA